MGYSSLRSALLVDEGGCVVELGGQEVDKAGGRRLLEK